METVGLTTDSFDSIKREGESESLEEAEKKDMCFYDTELKGLQTSCTEDRSRSRHFLHTLGRARAHTNKNKNKKQTNTEEAVDLK